MNIKDYLPIYNKLNDNTKKLLNDNLKKFKLKKGKIIYHDKKECTGLLFVESGKLRAYMESKNGKQITLYRLFENDICLFSASCMFKGLNVSLNMCALEDCIIYVLPNDIYKKISDSDNEFNLYINNILHSRLSEIMWVFEQTIFDNLDCRLANYLLEQTNSYQTNTLLLTHEDIANDIGSSREVITRLLNKFKLQGLVKLERNKITVINIDGLNELSE